MLLEHEKKLADHMNDPLGSDLLSRGTLWLNVLFNNGAYSEQIIQGRIRGPKNAIKRQRDNLEKCLREHGLST